MFYLKKNKFPTNITFSTCVSHKTYAIIINTGKMYLSFVRYISNTNSNHILKLNQNKSEILSVYKTTVQ